MSGRAATACGTVTTRGEDRQDHSRSALLGRVVCLSPSVNPMYVRALKLFVGHDSSLPNTSN